MTRRLHAEGNRVKRTHRLAQQVTTYLYDHRNRLIETGIGEAAVAADLGTVAVDGTNYTPSYFNGGQSIPAGRYRVEYVEGAYETGLNPPNSWLVYAELLHSGGATNGPIVPTPEVHILPTQKTNGTSPTRGRTTRFEPCTVCIEITVGRKTR